MEVQTSLAAHRTLTVWDSGCSLSRGKVLGRRVKELVTLNDVAGAIALVSSASLSAVQPVRPTEAESAFLMNARMYLAKNLLPLTLLRPRLHCRRCGAGDPHAKVPGTTLRNSWSEEQA